MGYALVISHKQGLGETGGTSSAIDTSGANLITLIVGGTGTPSSVTDNKGNTYTLRATGSGASQASRIYSATNPTVGSGHTFTVSAPTNTFVSLIVLAFSGADTSSPFDQNNGVSTDGVTSIQPGSVTPSVNDELLVCSLGLGGDVTNLAIGSSFTLQENLPLGSGVNYAAAGAYKIQTSAGAENPQWTWTTSRNAASAIATFKPAPPPAGINMLLISAVRE